MSYRANPVLVRLDRIAESTGFPAFSQWVSRRAARPFRVMPLLLLTLAVVGVALLPWAPLIGNWMTLAAWIVGMPLQVMGPMGLPPRGLRDERERALVRSGHFAGLAAVALLAIGGCFLFGLFATLALLRHATLWVPHLLLDWFALGYFLLAVHGNVSLLVASWQIPRRSPEADEG